jgi:hypothetical protein
MTQTLAKALDRLDGILRDLESGRCSTPTPTNAEPARCEAAAVADAPRIQGAQKKRKPSSVAAEKSGVKGPVTPVEPFQQADLRVRISDVC